MELWMVVCWKSSTFIKGPKCREVSWVVMDLYFSAEISDKVWRCVSFASWVIPTWFTIKTKGSREISIKMTDDTLNICLCQPPSKELTSFWTICRDPLELGWNQKKEKWAGTRLPLSRPWMGAVGENLQKIRKIRQPSKGQGKVWLDHFHRGCYFAWSRSAGSFSDEGGSVEGHSPKKAKV